MNQKRQVPRSERFEDVYFSAENGMAETQHVFLDGNNVPARLAALKPRQHFTICETGFGTGLNFLMTAQLALNMAINGQVIDFISIERYPLSKDQIVDAHQEWACSFEKPLQKLLEHYPDCTSGTHKLNIREGLNLTLVFDDVNAALPELNINVDCWYLDGFKPSTNPDMWSDTVFEHMARLSNVGATFATFTSAGIVRRGLKSYGFDVSKRPGYGRKREMITGTFNPDQRTAA